MSTFFNGVTTTLDQKQVHILVGDLNANALHHETNLDDGLLDFVYSLKTFLGGKK